MHVNDTLSGIRQAVASAVRVELARRNMSAAELARRAGVRQSYISRRMTGESPFNIDDLARIADVLGVQMADLLPRTSQAAAA